MAFWRPFDTSDNQTDNLGIFNFYCIRGILDASQKLYQLFQIRIPYKISKLLLH